MNACRKQLRNSGWRCATGALALAGLLMAGCDDKPRAPPLVQGEAVYHNQREGFRLEPPSGWSQHGRVESLSGPQDQERVLVKYKRLDASGPAFFRASLIDLPESTAVESFLRSRPPGPDNWRPTSESEPLQVDGWPAIRISYAGVWEAQNKLAVVKEVVGVRRGERVYFFTGIFPAGDRQARALIRKVVASIEWDKEPAQ